jgi:hypothetical protein
MSSQLKATTVEITNNGSRSLHHNNGTMGLLKTDGNWAMYTDNSGHVWSAVYGWLHDYFFSGTSNCIRAAGLGPGNFAAGNNGNCTPGETNIINCYGGGNMYGTQFEVIDNGSTIYPRAVRYYYNCNCVCDCACTCK